MQPYESRRRGRENGTQNLQVAASPNSVFEYLHLALRHTDFK